MIVERLGPADLATPDGDVHVATATGGRAAHIAAVLRPGLMSGTLATAAGALLAALLPASPAFAAARHSLKITINRDGDLLHAGPRSQLASELCDGGRDVYRVA